ncbi:PucR family transcriptional regulator [Nesterenkonia flava]|uniref:PucR family transcriptional regulator n=1 Tax=Nesterenkonia flava TaxID=469799 RepID=A0ABU1FVM7_9MICC|nr:PucR family transcriptional regulator [Nesterenkonia flava]MDR5712233.1 PucR family transcriptional regulator [Nesterenkonia flava]
MRVSDVVSASEFHIDVAVPGPEGALGRSFTWSVPTESIDPTEFLTPGTLVLTSGVGMNVTDVRVWDAYVERLARVPAAALVFGVGPAHPQVPQGLIDACQNQGLPLLLVPPEVPFPLVQREVQDRVTAERYDMIRRGSELAQQCSELVARGGTLHDVLHHIASTVGERALIEDRTGAELLRAGGPGPIIQRAEFTLPSPDNDAFRLVIEASQTSQLVTSLIRPATAVLALQLAATLGSTAMAYSRSAGRLVEAIYSRSTIETEDLLALTRDAELDPFRPIGVVLLQVDSGMSVTYLRTLSWRIRTRLGAEFPTMRFVEDADLSTVLVQGKMTMTELSLIVSESLGNAPSTSCVIDVVENSAELGLTLRHLRRSLGAPGVTTAPPMNFDAVVDTLSHPGSMSLARRLLAPLNSPEHHPLRETLESYLKHSGVKSAICDELFIHRNTLSYRLRKIEELLGMDLQNGQNRAILMLSLRLA